MVVDSWLDVQDNGSERRGEERRGGEPSVNHSTRVRNVVTETNLLPAVFAFVAVMVLLSSWTSTSITPLISLGFPGKSEYCEYLSVNI